MVTLADILDIVVNIGLIVIGVVVGFIASVLRDSVNIKNKTKQEFKIKKQQKLEELLNLLETINKDSLISMSLNLTEDSNEQIKILKYILQSQFENQEIITYNEDNYAKIKTIASLYLNKYEQHVNNHIAMIKGLDLYRQLSLENSINATKLVHGFRNKPSLMRKDAEKVEKLNKKVEEDKCKEEELEKEIDISLSEFKIVIVKELKS